MSDLQDIANILNIDNSENIKEIELEIEPMTELCKIRLQMAWFFIKSGVYKLSKDLVLYPLVYLWFTKHGKSALI